MKVSYKSVPQQAVHLLEVECGEKLGLMESIQGCTFFKDEGNAEIFLAIVNVEKRDRWLEINLGFELKVCRILLFFITLDSINILLIIYPHSLSQLISKAVHFL
jgi:hypothetical protein